MNIIKKTYCLLLVLLYSTILHAQDSRWNVNIYDYQYDMSVYAELQHNGSVITDFTNIEVAAFVGSECRAVGVPQYKDGVRWIYFRVRSNNIAGENVVFKMYDKTEDKEYYLSSEKNIEFEANRSLGLPSSPITLLKTVLYSVSVSSSNESMGSATVENYVGEAPENSNVIVKATPAIGHSFVEWTNNGETVSTDNPYSFKITKDTHLVANFKINQYTISFDTDGGSEILPICQDYNTAITAPVNPTKTGCTFVGWDKEIPTTMPAENTNIKALWTINKYTLTYNVDGEVYKQYEVEYNATITPEAVPVKEGHSFSGWSEIPATMPANDVDVNGTFTINKYKVTFVVDGVTVKEDMLDYGSAIIAPKNPTKVGYTFTSWNPPFDATVPAHDVTYVAQFTINQYTITFDTDGGSEIAPITQDYNTAVTVPADPTKIGYTFSGWDKEIPTTMPAENITIKSLWTINKYMLTYKVDGEVYKQYEVEYNATITPEAVPVKEGHSFSGWSEIPATMPANDVEVNGTFTINQYKVSFVVDGVTVKEETLDFGSAIVAPENPIKIGHTFTGWNPAIDAMVPAHDVTYIAQFSVNQYTITFDTDGGSEIAPITQDYNTAITAPANPTKTGYTFAGWDKEIPTLMPAEDITINALWTINQYTITFDTDGGSEIAPITQDYNTAVTVPADPTKIGYTFSGWDKEIPTTMPAENITIKSLWTINKYMLTYKVDGEVYKQYEVEYNATITPEAVPVKEGHSFSGWSEIPATMPANDIEITGSFSVNKYLLTYKVDGEIYHQDSVTFGSAIILIDEPALEGKTFSGWKGAPETMPAHDVTIVGNFNSNVYTLTYKVDGEVFKSVQYEFGESIVPEPEPTKEGHTFSGWSAIPETMPAHDVEVTGSFNITQYKVTFISEGVIISEEFLDFGSPISAPEDPTKIGHTFIGWNPAIDSTVPAHDVTYTAQFSINKYKLIYIVDGEKYIEYEIEYSSVITPEAAPEKEGYTFSGWSEIPATMPANDVEVNGTFTINHYKVTFVVEGEIIKQETLDFGSEITPPDDPTKVGYTFTGWNPTVDSTVPAHDVTYEAIFEINKYKLTYYVDGDIYKQFEVDYDSKIIPEENPVKEGYNFSGWSEIPQYMPDHDVDVYGSFISTGIYIFKSNSGKERKNNLSGIVIKHVKKGINIINGKKVLIK